MENYFKTIFGFGVCGCCFECEYLGVVIAVIAVLAMLLLPPLTCPCSGRRVSRANNLKQIGLSLKMYANESRCGYFPRADISFEQPADCSSEDYPLLEDKVVVYTSMFYMPSMYSEYLPDARILMCPKTEGAKQDKWQDIPYVASDAAGVCA